MIYPIDPGIEFLFWIEETRTTMPNDCLFQSAPQLHAAYRKQGLRGATGWLEYMIEHPASKGHISPPVARGCNHFLVALYELGLSTPATHKSTRNLIEQKGH